MSYLENQSRLTLEVPALSKIDKMLESDCKESSKSIHFQRVNMAGFVERLPGERPKQPECHGACLFVLDRGSESVLRLLASQRARNTLVGRFEIANMSCYQTCCNDNLKRNASSYLFGQPGDKGGDQFQQIRFALIQLYFGSAFLASNLGLQAATLRISRRAKRKREIAETLKRLPSAVFKCITENRGEVVVR